nr:hypothetical protein [Azospirillum baldaniorum]
MLWAHSAGTPAKERPAREDLREVGQQGCRHARPRRQAGDIDTPVLDSGTVAVKPLARAHRVDHGDDSPRFPWDTALQRTGQAVGEIEAAERVAIAGGPSDHGKGIVLLLRQQDDKAVAVSYVHPSGIREERRRILLAAVKKDQKRSLAPHPRAHGYVNARLERTALGVEGIARQFVPTILTR